jgi:hypothetical protein
MNKFEGVEIKLHKLLISALDTGHIASFTSLPVYSGEISPAFIGQEAGSAPESIWTLWKYLMPRPGINVSSLVIYPAAQ